MPAAKPNSPTPKRLKMSLPGEGSSDVDMSSPASTPGETQPSGPPLEEFVSLASPELAALPDAQAQVDELMRRRAARQAEELERAREAIYDRAQPDDPFGLGTRPFHDAEVYEDVQSAENALASRAINADEVPAEGPVDIAVQAAVAAHFNNPGFGGENKFVAATIRGELFGYHMGIGPAAAPGNEANPGVGSPNELEQLIKRASRPDRLPVPRHGDRPGMVVLPLYAFSLTGAEVSSYRVSMQERIAAAMTINEGDKPLNYGVTSRFGDCRWFPNSPDYGIDAANIQATTDLSSKGKCAEINCFGNVCGDVPTRHCQQDHHNGPHFVCDYCHQHPANHDLDEEDATIKRFRLYLCEDCTKERFETPLDTQEWIHPLRADEKETRTRKLYTCMCTDNLSTGVLCRTHRVARFGQIREWGTQKVASFIGYHQGRVCADPMCASKKPPMSEGKVLMWECAACDTLVCNDVFGK
jgi:hypothetical protein